jgi:hypothetical protein
MGIFLLTADRHISGSPALSRISSSRSFDASMEAVPEVIQRRTEIFPYAREVSKNQCVM